MNGGGDGVFTGSFGMLEEARRCLLLSSVCSVEILTGYCTTSQSTRYMLTVVVRLRMLLKLVCARLTEPCGARAVY